MQNSLLKTYHKSIIGTLLAMLFISVLIIISLVSYAINYAAGKEESNFSQILTAEAENTASEIMLWFEDIKVETHKFVDQINTRIKAEDPHFIEDTTLKFITEQAFLNASIYDADMHLLYSSQNQDILNQEQSLLLAKAFELKTELFSPLYQDQEGQQGLMLSLAYPIFAPDEIEEYSPVAMLLLEIPATNQLAELLIATQQEIPFTNRLMQWIDNPETMLQGIDLRNNSLYSITNWESQRGKSLPFIKRQTMLGDTIYSLALPINGYDLLISYEIPAYYVEDMYSDFSFNMVAMAVAGIVLVLLIISFSWYFLIIHNRKELEKKMLLLYNDINTKEQLLNSVNSTLQDGLVFTDNVGNIQYANTGFANMIQYQAEALVGYKLINFLHPDVADCLQRQMDKVIKTKSAYMFEEKLTIKNKLLYLQSMCTPYIDMQNEVLGVVSVYRDMTDISLEREAEQKRIEQLVQCFTRAIEDINPYLCGHSLALATLALQLAKNLHCSLEDEKTIHIAAALSQIGMIGIPQELLNKKEQLTDEEREIIYTHTMRSSKILKDFDFDLPVQIVIEQMNENMDGSGYPRSLKGEEINFLARILNVSNAFCAMLRPRIYRQPKSIEETIAIFDSNQNQFDPRVLTVLYAYIATEEGKEFVKTLQNQNIVE